MTKNHLVVFNISESLMEIISHNTKLSSVWFCLEFISSLRSHWLLKDDEKLPPGYSKLNRAFCDANGRLDIGNENGPLGHDQEEKDSLLSEKKWMKRILANEKRENCRVEYF